MSRESTGVATLAAYKKGSRVGRATFKGHPDTVTCLALSSSGTLISGSADGQVRLWYYMSAAHTNFITGHSGAVCDVAWHPVDDMLFASVGMDGEPLR